MSLETLGAATKRGNRALAHVVGIERGDQGQATALLLWRRFRSGLGGGRRADGAARAATDLARTFILIGNIGRDSWGACGRQGGAGRRLGLGFAETLFGLQFGFALGFLVVAAVVLLFLPPGGRRQLPRPHSTLISAFCLRRSLPPEHPAPPPRPL